jgi:acetyl esterase/lipase
MILFRTITVIALIALGLAGITLLRPRRGWGRLVLFIPKLFAGTNIAFIGLIGLLGAVLGWIFYQDAWTLAFGLISFLIAVRHIARIIQNGRKVSKAIAGSRPGGQNLREGMLPYPYLGIRKPPTGARFMQDVQIDIAPSSGEPLLADLWLPADEGNRSGVGLIYLHGSGWHYADKDFGTRPFFRQLCSQGHIVLDLAYTLAPQTDLFSMMADIKRTIIWLKIHAMEWGISAEKIVLAGGSAGGHLALLAGYTPNHPRLDPPGPGGNTGVCGVISYYGPTDLREQFNRFNELPGLTGKNRFEQAFMDALEARFGFKTLPVHKLLPVFLGGTPEQVPDLYDLGSPLTHVNRSCPPTLLLQGLHDFSGAVPQVRQLYQSLKAAGCPAYLFELPDCEHGFDLYKPIRSPAAQAATFVTERFLANLC